MRVPSPSDRIYACARQFTMNLRYAFNNCAFARMRTYVLRNQLRVLRVLSVRKCADFHENRLIYVYLSTWVNMTILPLNNVMITKRQNVYL